MNAFDEARREVLAALLMDYHRSSGGIADFQELKQRYGLKAREEWFDPIISEVEQLLIVSRTFDGIAARIHPRGYGEILRDTLQNLNASTLEISWPKEEVLSDAADYEWFPLPSGWKWFSIKRDQDNRGVFDPNIFDPEIFDTEEPVDSSRWTGLPKKGILSPEASNRLLAALKIADDGLEKSGASNEQKAQAKAYIVAIQALAEAPEPPADLIWKLVERLNSVAGIAGLFFGLVSLFS